MIESFVKTTRIQYQFQVTKEDEMPTENGWVDAWPKFGADEILWQRIRHVSDWAKAMVGIGNETDHAKAMDGGVSVSEYRRREMVLSE